MRIEQNLHHQQRPTAPPVLGDQAFSSIHKSSPSPSWIGRSLSDRRYRVRRIRMRILRSPCRKHHYHFHLFLLGYHGYFVPERALVTPDESTKDSVRQKKAPFTVLVLL